MPSVKCEVLDGSAGNPFETAVAVVSAQGRKEILQVPPDLLDMKGDTAYLPVSVVAVDRAAHSVLIELPSEADSGTNRMWVPSDSMPDADEVLA
jgi:hypothetical protein